MEKIMHFLKLASLTVSFLVLSSCGGGGGGGSSGGSPGTITPTTTTLNIVAAVGTPIVNGTINFVCAAGGAVASSSTGSTGTVQITLTGQTLPCAVEVTGGTINGVANTTPYHSIVIAAGTVNVTPLTDLLVANLAGSSAPATWFAGLSGNPAQLSAFTPTKVNASLANLGTALSGLTPLSANNPVTTTFTPTSGDVSDDMLTALAIAMANTGVTHASLQGNASTPSFTAPVSGFNTALANAYAGTASGGGYTIGGTVSGLTGTVVLQDNGGDNLSLSANGAFTFRIKFTSGSAYSVSVLTQPSGQTCTVTGGSGTATSNVTGVAVNCTAVVAGVSVTCPNGTSSTAATTALANAACPVPTLVSVTPANGDNTVSPTTFAGITVNTDSLLDPTSITLGSITLSVGGVPISFSDTTIFGIPATQPTLTTNNKGFVFVPSTVLQFSVVPLQLLYGSTYTFSATVKDTLGRSLVVNSTFTTLAVSSCVAPARANLFNVCISPPAVTGYTWNDIIKAWVADIGVLVTGANTLPAACLNVGDACWLASVADGTIKFVNSGVVETGINTRPIVFAYYMYSFSGCVNCYNDMPIYADVQANGPYGNRGTSNGGGAQVMTTVRGASDGLKEYYQAFGCYEYILDGTLKEWRTVPSTGC